MIALKFVPYIVSWAAIVLVLIRGFQPHRRLAAALGSAGFAAGVAGGFFLLQSFKGDTPFGAVKIAVGGTLLLLWGVSVAALYRSTGRGGPSVREERLSGSRIAAGAVAVVVGVLAGVVFALKFSSLGGDNLLLTALAAILAACALSFLVLAVEKLLPASVSVSFPGQAAALVALLLFSSSCQVRLDLFSPLTMKVMKFTHDFVHQFFESMLLPDHFFFTTTTWNLIGYLFSNGIGFWGGLVIWFIPPILIVIATRLERLPSVAHIRQGAQRRRVLASAINARRCRLIIPVIAVGIFAASVYQSRFPTVEYWDPKPLAITADPSGEIFIPKKGEVDLEDGKLHKYLYKRGGQEARFFILMTPEGKLTAVLDACSICKPDGYGQAEGNVICYYCKTLIPLETVGKPGGCNPVPLPFTEKDDGVHIDGITLLNTWSGTVQSTTRVKGDGK